MFQFIRNVRNYFDFPSWTQASRSNRHPKRIIRPYLHRARTTPRYASPQRRSHQARINTIQAESKKKLAHGREVHDEKQQALSKKYKVSLEIAKMGRDALEEYLNEKSY